MKIELSKDDRFHLDEGVIHMSSELAKPIAFFPPEADPPPADAPHTAPVRTALDASKQSLLPKNRTKVFVKKHRIASSENICSDAYLYRLFRFWRH